jgi:hypothetical protein
MCSFSFGNSHQTPVGVLVGKPDGKDHLEEEGADGGDGLQIWRVDANILNN